jgi:hypothetical protein
MNNNFTSSSRISSKMILILTMDVMNSELMIGLGGIGGSAT